MRIMLSLLSLAFAAAAFGHSGGLDSSGGHRNSKTGSYHYHGGGSSAATRRSYPSMGRLSTPIRQDYERRARLREYASKAELKAKHDRAIADERKAARWRACQRVEAVEVIGTDGRDTLHDLFAKLYPDDGHRPLNDGTSVMAAATELRRSERRSDVRDALVHIILTYPESHEAGEAFDSLVTLDHHLAEEHERENSHEEQLKLAAAKEERERYELAHNERKATARLHMAQQLIRVGHTGSVKDRLETIIEENAETEAAKEAAKLLARL